MTDQKKMREKNSDPHLYTEN